MRHDVIEGLPPVYIDQYKRMTGGIIQEICKEHELPLSSGSNDTLRKILKLDDMVTKLQAREEEEGAEMSRVIEATDELVARGLGEYRR